MRDGSEGNSGSPCNGESGSYSFKERKVRFDVRPFVLGAGCGMAEVYLRWMPLMSAWLGLPALAYFITDRKP